MGEMKRTKEQLEEELIAQVLQTRYYKDMMEIYRKYGKSYMNGWSKSLKLNQCLILLCIIMLIMYYLK